MTLTEYKATLPEGAKLIPILFSTPMVQAIMDGRKTQTRREVKPQPEWDQLDVHNGKLMRKGGGVPSWYETGIKCPYGKPGDILWVRETHWVFGEWEPNGPTKTGKQKWEFKQHIDADVQYNEPGTVMPSSHRKPAWYKRPSIHMPFEACRLFLKVKSVKVERLKDINEWDAKAEGIERSGEGWKGYRIIRQGPHKGKPHPYNDLPNEIAKYSFIELWESINGPDSWEANPWVWVIEFERLPK